MLRTRNNLVVYEGGIFLCHPVSDKPGAVRVQIDLPEGLHSLKGDEKSYHLTLRNGSVGNGMAKFRVRDAPQFDAAKMLENLHVQTENARFEFQLKAGHPLITQLKHLLRSCKDGFCGRTPVTFWHYPDQGSFDIIMPRKFEAYAPRPRNVKVAEPVPKLPEVKQPEVKAETGMSSDCREFLAYVAKECKSTGLQKNAAILEAIRIFDEEYSK